LTEYWKLTEEIGRNVVVAAVGSVHVTEAISIAIVWRVTILIVIARIIPIITVVLHMNGQWPNQDEKAKGEGNEWAKGLHL
jgi:hypothetical protein